MSLYKIKQLRKERSFLSYTKERNSSGHLYETNHIKISLMTDGAVSFFNDDNGDSHIYLYPNQVRLLLNALLSREQNEKP